MVLFLYSQRILSKKIMMDKRGEDVIKCCQIQIKLGI